MKRNLKQLATRWMALIFAASLVITNVDLLLLAEDVQESVQEQDAENAGGEVSEADSDGEESNEGDGGIQNQDADSEGNHEQDKESEEPGSEDESSSDNDELNDENNENDVSSSGNDENSSENGEGLSDNDESTSGNNTESTSGNNTDALDVSANDASESDISENDASANDLSTNDLSTNDIYADIDFDALQVRINALPTVDEFKTAYKGFTDSEEKLNYYLEVSESVNDIIDTLYEYKLIDEDNHDDFVLVETVSDRLNIERLVKLVTYLNGGISTLSEANDIQVTLKSTSVSGEGLSQSITATVSVINMPESGTKLYYKVLNRYSCNHGHQSGDMGTLTDNEKHHAEITGELTVSDGTATITGLRYGDHIEIYSVTEKAGESEKAADAAEGAKAAEATKTTETNVLYRFKTLSDKLLNGSFEITGEASDKNADDNALTPRNLFFESTDVYGWHTTAANHFIEIGKKTAENRKSSSDSDYYGDRINSNDGTNGDNAAELCGANEKSGLYQEIKTEAGQTLTWSLKHRSNTNSSGADTMAVVIGPAINISNVENSYSGYQKADVNTADLFMNVVATLGTINADMIGKSIATTYANNKYQVYLCSDVLEWKSYSDTYTVPEGQAETVFGFVALGTEGTYNSTDMSLNSGNLLDDVTFGVYSAPSVSKVEIGEPSYSNEDKLTESITATLTTSDFPEYEELTYEVVNRQVNCKKSISEHGKQTLGNPSTVCLHDNVTGTATYADGKATITGLKYGDHVVVKYNGSTIYRFKVLSDKLLNGSFETIKTAYGSCMRTGESIYAWHTTAWDLNMEWGQTYEKTSKGSINPKNGSYIAELNAWEVASLYQEVSAIPGETLSWSVAHRGRQGKDEMAIVVGPALSVGDTDVYRKNSQDEKTDPDIFQQIVSEAEAKWGELEKGNTYEVKYSGNNKTYQVVVAPDENYEWVTYYGTYKVPRGVTEVVFGFTSIYSASSSQGIGNLIDAVSFGVYTEPKVDTSSLSLKVDTAQEENSRTLNEAITATLDVTGYPEYDVLTYEVVNRQESKNHGANDHVKDCAQTHANISGTVTNNGNGTISIPELKYGDHVAIKYNGETIANFKVLSTELLNGGFEETTYDGPCRGEMRTGDGVYAWHTTASDLNMEIRSDSGHSGKQNAELNAYEFASIYQEIKATEGDVLDWSIKHAGRNGTDTMAIVVGPALKAGTEYTKSTADESDFFAKIVQAAKDANNGTLNVGRTYKVPYNGSVYQVVVATDDKNSWKTYSGSYTVPKGVSEVVFGFSALSSSGGDSKEGNLIDDVTFGKSERIQYKDYTVKNTSSGQGEQSENLSVEVDMSNCESNANLKYKVTNRTGANTSGEFTASGSDNNCTGTISGLKYGDNVQVTDANGKVQFSFKVLSNELLNGSFETNDGSVNNSNKTSSTVKTGTNLYGWHTTASDANMKLSYTGNNGIDASDDSYYAGLTTDENASMYQEINTKDNKDISWSIAHASEGNDTAKMAVVIGPALDATESYTKSSSTSNDIFMDIVKKAGTMEKGKTYSVDYNGNTYTVLYAEDESSDWTTYSGLYKVPEGQNETVVAYVPLSDGNLIDAVSFGEPKLTTKSDVSGNDLIVTIGGMDSDKDGTKYAVLDKDGNVVTGVTATKNGGEDEESEVSPDENGWFTNGNGITSLTLSLPVENGPYTVVRSTASNPTEKNATKISKVNVIKLSNDGEITWYSDPECENEISGITGEALGVNGSDEVTVYFKVSDPTKTFSMISSYVSDGTDTNTKIEVVDVTKGIYKVTYKVPKDESKTLTVIQKTDSSDAVKPDESGNITPNIPWADSSKVGDIVVKDETEETATLNTNEVFNSLLSDRTNITDENLATYANGGKIEIVFKAEENYNVNDETLEIVNLMLAGQLKGYEEGQYLDIQIIKNIYADKNSSALSYSEPIKELKEKITITVSLPENLINTDSTMTRTYMVIRVHEPSTGGTEQAILSAPYNAENQTISFQTDKFSDYVIVYKDSAKSSGSSGNSGDSDDSGSTIGTTVKATIETAVTTVTSTIKKTFAKKKAKVEKVDATEDISKITDEEAISGNDAETTADTEADKTTDTESTTDTVIEEESGTGGETELISENPNAEDTDASDSWALVNMIAMLLTSVIAIARLPKVLKDKEYIKLAGLAPMAIAIILFFVTEDLSGALGFVDGWTIVMLLLLAIEAGLTLIKGKEEK